jgi:Domain of unknown function (DUF4203)
MFFQTVAVSLLLILMGLALCFAGYRFFVILLPIWGFFAGFQFGASILNNIFGQGFLTTVLGWVIGLLVGIFAAVLAYLFYAVAVVLLAGFVGYQLGAGIMTWIGFKSDFVTFLVGLIFALAIVALAIYLRLPKVLIIILTAFAGAGAILAGLFLALGQISINDLQFGEVGAVVRTNWFWALVYLAIAALGFFFQWRTTQTFVVEEYAMGSDDAGGETVAATMVETTVETTPGTAADTAAGMSETQGGAPTPEAAVSDGAATDSPAASEQPSADPPRADA